MITQYQVPGLLREEIPALAMETYPGRASLEIFATINFFTDCTRHAVEEHNFSLARKCFELAENIYCNGDRMVRMLIENSFIHSMSSFLPADRTERRMIRAIIPNRLYTIYLKQVIGFGC